MAARNPDDPLDSRRPFLSLLAVSAVPLVIGLLMTDATPGSASALRPGDLRHAEIVEIRTSDGRTVLSGELRSRVDSLGNIEKDAALVAPDGREVVGEIEIDVPRPAVADRKPQELEIDIIHLAPRTTFTVVIDDRPVATFKTDDRGSVDVEIESAPRASTAPVPAR
jgi:hypothetical protein